MKELWRERSEWLPNVALILVGQVAESVFVVIGHQPQPVSVAVVAGIAVAILVRYGPPKGHEAKV